MAVNVLRLARCGHTEFTFCLLILKNCIAYEPFEVLSAVLLKNGSLGKYFATFRIIALPCIHVQIVLNNPFNKSSERINSVQTRLDEM